MTAEQLMKPRFKVIADYPSSPHTVGDIYQQVTKYHTRHEYYEKIDGFNPHHVHLPEKHSAIFKPLQWWEERSLDDMPEYLSTGKGVVGEAFQVYKIIEWENDNGNIIGWIDKQQRSVCSLGTFKPEYEYQPATKEEYEQLKQSNP